MIRRCKSLPSSKRTSEKLRLQLSFRSRKWNTISSSWMKLWTPVQRSPSQGQESHESPKGRKNSSKTPRNRNRSFKGIKSETTRLFWTKGRSLQTNRLRKATESISTSTGRGFFPTMWQWLNSPWTSIEEITQKCTRSPLGGCLT